MRSLITGVAGFVGRYLALACLHAGDDVHGIGRGHIHDDLNIDYHQADLRDRDRMDDVLRTVRPDVVYHLAAQSNVAEAWRDPAATLSNNLVTQANLFQSCIEAGLAPIIVSVGSSDCYGRIDPACIPINEDTPFRPTNPYGVSKASQDLLSFQYFASHRLPIIRMRPFNHIGPGQSDRFAVAAFVRQIVDIEHGTRDPILHVGDLSPVRDFTDVRDVVTAYRVAALRGVAGEAYNIGSGHGTPIRTVVDELLSMTTTPIRLHVSEDRLRPVEVPVMICDASKFCRTTGWQPRVALRQSLVDILDAQRRIVAR